MQIFERKLQGIAGSLLVTLPKEWANTLGLKKGSKLRFMLDSKGSLTILPASAKPEDEKREGNITLDDTLVRRFFKEYFLGCDRITIRTKKGTSPELKKQAYSFFKKFINVQVIEESDGKIVLKSFKVEELSIEDCFSRMFYLTLNMIDELQEENNPEKMEELRTNVKRFYYMLVMQIRRFIGEGKFTQENQISLLRAMDYRMAGEKVDQVADIARQNSGHLNAESEKILSQAREQYRLATQHFISEDFEKSIISWQEVQAFEKKCEQLLKGYTDRKKINEYKALSDINNVLKITKQIAMLTR